MEVLSGFIIGLLGSFHCVGMCGPIAVALPVYQESRLKLITGRALYNFGRIVTYSLMGALFGLFGSRLVIFGLQQYLSVGFGVLIIAYVFTPGKVKSKFSNISIYRFVTDFIKKHFAKLTEKKTLSSLFLIGLLNGLLPCGFVYVGIAGAVSTGGVISGALFMALFGLGTFPIMFAASLVGKFVNLNVRKRINKLIPVFAVILAVLFILRGLNLGIPYVSPKFSKSGTPHMMHH
jgi:sulfite exporter TauE/SafE